MAEETLLTCRSLLFIGIQHNWELSACVCPTERRPEPAAGTKHCLGGPFFCADLVTRGTAKSSFLGMGRREEKQRTSSSDCITRGRGEIAGRELFPWSSPLPGGAAGANKVPCGQIWAHGASTPELPEQPRCSRLWVSAVITSSCDFLIEVRDPKRYQATVAQTCCSQCELSYTPNFFKL